MIFSNAVETNYEIEVIKTGRNYSPFLAVYSPGKAWVYVYSLLQV